MKAVRLTRFAICLILSGCAISREVCAQTLGDVARKEEERRKAVGPAGKVYTNKDLPSVPPASTTAPAEPPKQEPQAVAPKDQPKDAQADGKNSDKPVVDKAVVKDQAYWSERKKTLQTQLDRDQTVADALQSRINALTTDFVNRSDPAQRAVIERDRQKALAELATLKKQIDDDKKGLAGLEEEARRAGVPPGWLR
jgi:hypothetical protein